MSIRVDQCIGLLKHRGGTIYNIVPGLGLRINGVPYLVLETDAGWLVGPGNFADEPHYPDYGPYETAETAVVTARLLHTP